MTNAPRAAHPAWWVGWVVTLLPLAAACVLAGASGRWYLTPRDSLEVDDAGAGAVSFILLLGSLAGVLLFGGVTTLLSWRLARGRAWVFIVPGLVVALGVPAGVLLARG